MSETINPNTFLVGAQKSATSSVYNWIAQHPDVCGPPSLKDYAFFVDDGFYSQGIEMFHNDYIEEGYKDQKIIIQGSVQYMFYQNAIDRLFEFDPDAKLIVVLRNPTERAFSAYKYAKKMTLEPFSFSDALEKEEKRQQGDKQEKSELTYFSHGLYGKQLSYIFSKFKKSQVLVLFYENVKNNPREVAKKSFQFLGVDDSFIPEFKVLNRTGKVKFPLLQKAVYSQGKFKKYLVAKFVDPILPLSKRIRVKAAFKEWNTRRGKNNTNPEELKSEEKNLKKKFLKDIELTEKLLNKDLSHWK